MGTLKFEFKLSIQWPAPEVYSTKLWVPVGKNIDLKQPVGSARVNKNHNWLWIIANICKCQVWLNEDQFEYNAIGNGNVRGIISYCNSATSIYNLCTMSTEIYNPFIWIIIPQNQKGEFLLWRNILFKYPGDLGLLTTQETTKKREREDTRSMCQWC